MAKYSTYEETELAWNSLSKDQVLKDAADWGFKIPQSAGPGGWASYEHYRNRTDQTDANLVASYREHFFKTKCTTSLYPGSGAKTWDNFVNGTTPSTPTTPPSTPGGGVGGMAVGGSPWDYLSASVEIDMGYSKESGQGLFLLFQEAGLMIGILLALSSIVGYIWSQNGQAKAMHKQTAIRRVWVTLLIAGSILILSLIMTLFNTFFGVS